MCLSLLVNPFLTTSYAWESYCFPYYVVGSISIDIWTSYIEGGESTCNPPVERTRDPRAGTIGFWSRWDTEMRQVKAKAED
ncbi:hypothetical protein C8R42DRAFT_665854 [Lentinula raphanica]|nr:hypothetical protein C8R42DRAFT_665854 [Lentinula raphanica]